MHFKIKKHYTHDDKMFLFIEIFIAFICMFIPLILYLSDGTDIVRKSISAYVDMTDSFIFGLLFGIAGMIFVLNGALYFRSELEDVRNPNLKLDITKKKYDKKRTGKWYNLIFGIALIGIAIFPYNRDFWYLHYIFAIIFFFGSAIVIFFIHDSNDKWKSKVFAIISVTGLIISFIDVSILPLFWAETIALIIISIHYILVSYRIYLHF